jgi:hypothetical protein
MVKSKAYLVFEADREIIVCPSLMTALALLEHFPSFDAALTEEQFNERYTEERLRDEGFILVSVSEFRRFERNENK